jgi:hypothetical protein
VTAQRVQLEPLIFSGSCNGPATPQVFNSSAVRGQLLAEIMDPITVILSL